MSLHVRLKKLQLRSSIYCACTSGDNSVNETVLNTYYTPGSVQSTRGMKMNNTQSLPGREQASKQSLGFYRRNSTLEAYKGEDMANWWKQG